MWKPKENRVALKPVPPEEKTKSGLIIPTEAQKVSEYEVLAIGPLTGSNLEAKIELLPGMHVIVNNGAGLDIEIDGEEQKVVQFSDIHLYDDEPKKA